MWNIFRAASVAVGIAQVSPDEWASIGRKSYERLRAISMVLSFDADWHYSGGNIEVWGIGIPGDFQVYRCDFKNKDEFTALLDKNAADDYYPAFEMPPYDEAPDRYVPQDGSRRIGFRPTYNMEYRHKGIVVDLGAVTA